MNDGPPPLEEGAALAPGYEVVEHLRRGSRLDVYDVWSEERDCRCVAKALRPDRLHEPRSRKALLGEGRLLTSLAHPHIVRAFEIVPRPQPVVVLETLTGHTLAQLLRGARRRLSLEDVVWLGVHLCSAMHYLHGRGFLHLDLKPSNVISEDGKARVLDLSIARPPGRARKGVGTRIYMAPEQARGGVLSEAADVWGIGVVLFEAATGRRPFSGNGDGPRYPQLERRADPIREHRRVPPAFAAVVDGCLEPDPGRRPALDELPDVLDALV
jgi:eukaryotic-like serine/threonine-protein kinase